MPTIITAPLDRFQNLEGYPFTGNFIEVAEGLNMHYLDEGPKDAPVVLLLHGEPSWSYLYRKMIPVLTERGLRCIAPDLIGFGKSDRFKEQEAYSYESHLVWMRSFLSKMELKDISLFCQDWGGLIGLRLVSESPDQFTRVLASNTILPTGQFPATEAFLKWREFSRKSPQFDIGRVLQKGTLTDLSEEVIRAYNAPFPNEEHKAGSRIFPMLVPIKPDEPEAINNQLAWQKLSTFTKPFLTIFGSGDPIMRGAEKVIKGIVPGAKGQDHKIIEAGHFIQEDKGEELAAYLAEFCGH